MGPNRRRDPATGPEDLSRFFVERANSGDVEGLVALYEPDAVLALPSGEVARGSDAIRKAYEQLLGAVKRSLMPTGAVRVVGRLG